MTARRKRTETSSFGSGRREGHDAAEFYARFAAPSVSQDETINQCSLADSLLQADARDMSMVEDNSVALVVTSPPYFAGKEYEQALGEGHVPGTYVEFLHHLYRVFSECVRVLEPGGRLAVNVANLGRRPYRSLSADLIRILQDDLRLLLRGEILWIKGEGASGSCAWGSFASASNPVFRDLSERVIVASKGRFDRAPSRKERERRGLPFENSISREAFMGSTLDVWKIPPESARRVGHPAPFPLELPRRLIELYTYKGDVVLDPFMGSGTTALAAVMEGRRYLGFETEGAYVELARKRLSGLLEDSSDQARVVPPRRSKT